MSYTICTQPQTPRMDTLPVYKITSYPLEPRDYKPFAQARLYLTPSELLLELWAFEMLPQPESRLRAVFCTAACDTLLVVECHAGGRVDCRAESPAGARDLSVTSHTLAGEDLQGIYWGAAVSIPRTLLEQLFGKGCVDVGRSLLGNVYKLSDSAKKPHKGSLHPADFAGNREYTLGSLAQFQIVNY